MWFNETIEEQRLFLVNKEVEVIQWDRWKRSKDCSWWIRKYWSWWMRKWKWFNESTVGGAKTVLGKQKKINCWRGAIITYYTLCVSITMAIGNYHDHHHQIVWCRRRVCTYILCIMVIACGWGKGRRGLKGVGKWGSGLLIQSLAAANNEIYNTILWWSYNQDDWNQFAWIKIMMMMMMRH